MTSVALKSYDFPAGDYQSTESTTRTGSAPAQKQSCRVSVASVFVVDRQTIFCKLYYFTCCAAFGSIRPFLSLILKQRGLSPLEIGVVSGIRTFAGSVSGITLSAISDRFHIRKILFIVTLLGWLVAGSIICFLPDPQRATACPHQGPLLGNDPSNGTAIFSSSFPRNVTSLAGSTASPTTVAAGISNHVSASTQVSNGIKPSSSTGSDANILRTTAVSQTASEEDRVHYPKESLWWFYDPSSRQRLFIVMLVVFALGDAFLVPYTIFGDTGILHMLDDRASTDYGAQRSWGPLGFGITALLTGTLLTSSRVQVPFCGESINVTNYALTAWFFIPLHVAAILCGLQFRFKEGQTSLEGKADEVTQYTCHHTGGVEHMQVTLQAELMVDLQKDTSSIMEHSDVTDLVQRKATSRKNSMTSFSSGQMTSSERFSVLRLLLTVQHGSWLLVVFYIGICNGLIWSFAFWHLENIGATQFMLGLGSIIGHVVEFAMCFFIGRLIDVLGHGGVLCLSLCSYVLRFALYASATSPWMVVPTDCLQGLALSSVWVCVTSYVTKTVPASNIATLQGIMGATFWGLGVGTGDFMAGPLVQFYGAVTTFYGLSVTTALVAIAFFALIRVRACIDSHRSYD